MKSKKFPMPFIVLSIITILPIIASTILYFNHNYFNLKTLNRGVLVTPAMNVKDLEIGSTNDKKWRIIYAESGQCDEHCKTLSFQLSQLTKILNKDRDRTIFMSVNGPYETLKKKFVQNGMKDFIVANRVYLIDPMGNLFMYYADTIDPMNILHDLKRVLEVSQVG
jgi:cytochrome oxidase Cu insertion factor (SCO1/SenC/PrrC family)